MLPVAPPKYFENPISSNDYQGGQHPHDHHDLMGSPLYVDPIDTSPVGMEGYQEMPVNSNNHHNHNYHQEVQVDDHHNTSSSMDTGLEAIRNQKIQEFREALEMDLELKRQQAQKVLEDAERLKWEKLLDFQQALQREFAQSSLPIQQQLQQQFPQQFHMSQQPQSYSQSNTPTQQQQQHGMGSASYQMYQQQQPSQQHLPQHMSLPPTPLHQYHNERFGSPMRQRQPTTPGRISQPQSPTRQYQPTSPMRQQQTTSPMRQQPQASPMYQPQQYSRGDFATNSPVHFHQHQGESLGMARQHQGIGSYTTGDAMPYNTMGQPIRQQPEQQYGGGEDRRISSPLRQSGMASPLRQQQQQGMGYLQSPPYNRSPSRPSTMPQHRTMSTASSAETPGAYYQRHTNDRGDPNSDIFRARGAPETFTFDEQTTQREETYRRSHISGAKSAGMPGPLSRQTPSREGIHSSATWNHRSRTRHNEPPPRQRVLLDEAERLEQEYAKLTGKTKKLSQIKLMQEERRLKLEELTARVVQNRRRLAHEMDNADRPIVISFEEEMAHEMEKEERRLGQARDESRQERQSPSRRHHQVGTRDEIRDGLTAVDEAEEPSETITGMGLEASSESEHIGHGKHGRTTYKSDTVTSSDEIDGEHLGESESDEKETRDFVKKIMSSHQKKKGSKGMKNADDFVERLRQKRSEALERERNGRERTPTRAYSRDEMLDALQVGKKPVTLPERDPKLARKNRKLSSHKLRDGKDNTSSRGRAAKIATKKPKATAKEEELKQAVARDLGLNDDTDSMQGDKEHKKPRASKTKTASDNQASPKNKKKGHKNNKGAAKEVKQHPQLEESKTGIIDNRTGERRRHRESSAVSLVSELSESAFGVLSNTESGGAVVDNDSSDNERTNECYTKESETTSSGFDEIKFDSFNDTPRRAARVLARDEEDEEDDEEEIEQMKIKVRELVAGSVSEGFEIEDAKSIYSRSAISSRAKHTPAYAKPKQKPKPISKDSRVRRDEPMTNVEALHELERRLDEQDRGNLMPDLLELTELYGWDLKKLLKHFVHFLPVDSGLDEMSLQHLLQIPMKAIQNEDFTNKFSISTRRTQGSHRKASSPPKQTPERRNPSSSAKVKADKTERRESKSGGWRERVRTEAESRSTSSSGDNHDDTIDMGDVRSSLKNLHKRNKRAARRAYKPELQSLDEISS